MSTNQAIISLYVDQANGLHRFNTEEFLQLEAREKLFHMGSGERLLDFGCGSGDLLVYYAEAFDQLIGVDISENMATRARHRAAEFGATNIEVRCGDDVLVWKLVQSESFDVITSAGVMQYLDTNQIRGFVRSARSHLTERGRIVMFDIIDPRLYWLVKYGWFRPRPLDAKGLLSALFTSARSLVRGAYRRLTNRKIDLIGRAHHPAAIAEIASAEGYKAHFVSSMYYEYRYHAILEPGGVERDPHAAKSR